MFRHKEYLERLKQGHTHFGELSEEKQKDTVRAMDGLISKMYTDLEDKVGSKDEQDIAMRSMMYQMIMPSLPEASATRRYRDYSSASTDVTSLCHGCGKECSPQDLKRCTQCKRVAYCSRDCQILDWKKPRHHKRYCQPDFLNTAMSNIHRLPLAQKMEAMINCGHVPNMFISQTINKVLCPSVDVLLQCAQRELDSLQVICTIPAHEAAQMEGNCQTDFVDFRYGLDKGIETLCLAINLFPDTYTVNSCSGLHAGAYVPSPKNGGALENQTPFVTYVSDNADTLAAIQRTVEKGALGVQFRDAPCESDKDRIGQMKGFCTIDCVLDDKPTKCRSLCREIWMVELPSDKLDDALWQESQPPYGRIQNALVGCFGVALELVKANPSLDLSGDERKRLSELQASATELRRRTITHANQRLGFDA